MRLPGPGHVSSIAENLIMTAITDAIQLMEPIRQRLHPSHQDGYLGPHLALESTADVLAAFVGLALRLAGCPSLRDSSSSVRARGVWPPYHSASTWLLGEVCLAVCVFIARDALVSRDPVNLGWDAVVEESMRSLIILPCESLPQASLRMCCSSMCGWGSLTTATVSYLCC